MKVIRLFDKNRDFIEAVNEYFKDHFNIFGSYPMDFEYEGKVYDFDECIRHVTKVSDKREGGSNER